MSFFNTDLDLAVRESKAQDKRAAQRALLQAALTGKGVSMEQMARARGATLRSREDSIFSDAWILVAILVLLLGFVNGRNAALLALGFILLIIVVVSKIWRNLALYGVSYERSYDRSHVFPGEPIEMTLTVRNSKRLPLTWLRFRDVLPVSPEVDNFFSQAAAEAAGGYLLSNTYSAHAWEQIARTVTLRFPRRGYYTLGPVTYKSGDIFTLFTIEETYQDIDTIVIYPRIFPLEELGLPAKEPFGELRVRRSLFTDPIRTQGIRDYQPQDRFRDVHWKATARRGELQTKVYDPSTGMTLAVFLNVTTMARYWMGFSPQLLERAVSVAASAASYGVEQGWGVGVYANGAVPNSDQSIRVAPGRSPNQLTHILEALAAVTEFATASIDAMMLRESPNLPWVATIVLVTAVVTDEITAALLRLREAGRRVVLISLADEPPSRALGDMLTYHIPSNLPAFAGTELDEHARTVAALSRIPTPAPVGLGPETDNDV